jgi:endonuclease/exonuclease/phosphatase family metal-dependent hydrolase
MNKIVFLSAFLLSLSALTYSQDADNHQNEPKDGKSVKLVSFNICVNPFSDERIWSNRKKLISSMVRTCDWDIIGTQEGSVEMMNDLCVLSGGYQWLGRAAYEGDNAVCMAVMYKSSRFDVLESGDFWYSETPDIPGSMAWDAPYIAKCTWVKFRDKSRKKVFYFFNSHYSASTKVSAAYARSRSSLLMMDKIEEIAGNDSKVFAAGDYNSVPGSAAINNILARGFLKDSRTLSEQLPSGPDNTFNGWQTPNNAKYDWIFVSAGIRVLSYNVLNNRPNGQFPSDHDPVVIDVEF